jgi:glutaredoxin
METYPMPDEYIYTIYGISNCIYCDKAKDFFKVNNLRYNLIDCDEYINNLNKNSFLKFIEEFANIKYNTFPIIFYGKTFIGGYQNLIDYVHRKCMTFDEDF